MNLEQLGKQAKDAATQLAQLNTLSKNKLLKKMAKQIIQQTDKILQANEKDLHHAKEAGISDVMQDRLRLTKERLEAMALGIEQIADLDDPIGKVDQMWTTEEGLEIGQKRVPLGVIGIIYESRPNVTTDAAALCFKSGNAVILRGGKEAFYSNLALTEALQQALENSQVPVTSIQFITDTSHETAEKLMQLNAYLDVLIPRGGNELIQRVVQTATVPVIETGTGNCHVYVDRAAQLQMAVDIIINGKCQRPSVCNALETLVIHEDVAEKFLPVIEKALDKYNVELRADQQAQRFLQNSILATEEDWSTEFLDYILAIKVVDSIDSAIKHINQYNTKHSEVIISDNYFATQKFLKEIDAAAVYANASTRFTDGFMYGFGAEIGISTQKLHARGPMGLTALTTIKYIVYGNGQIRK